jgi:hypothetical protein
MPECAFCPQSAKLSGEHLWSAWMGDLLPAKTIRFARYGDKGQVEADWLSTELDWTAKVVCEKCNNTWMSAIENDHAKPAMSSLILGKLDTEVTESTAHSIALFAFKTAVVFDHLQRARPRFYPRAARHAFRENLFIPPTVRMWMARCTRSVNGHVHSCYHEGKPEFARKTFELYICTYSVGQFLFQVVSERQPSYFVLSPDPRFEQFAIPFWPSPKVVKWETTNALKLPDEFFRFSLRWNRVDWFLPVGAN